MLTLDEYKRINSGLKISNKKVLSFDASTSEAYIQGSAPAPYYVTLDSCTCPDFAITGGKTCKHMYKLRALMGVAPAMIARNIEKEDEYNATIEPEIERYRELFFSGAISLDKMLKVIAALRSKNW